MAVAMLSSVKPKKLLCSRRRPAIVHCHGYPAPSVFKGNLTTSRRAFPYNCISNHHTRHDAKTRSSSTCTGISIASPPDEPRSGVDILVEALRREGVSDVFTNKDQRILLRSLMETTIDTHVFLNRHGELSAAKGYAIASGLPGVCMTSTENSYEFFKEMAHAFQNNVPLLIMEVDGWEKEKGEKGKEKSITPNNGHGGRCWEEFKCRFRITSAKDIPSIVREALFEVRSGRPGPVLIERIGHDILLSLETPVWDNRAPPPPPILPPAAPRLTDVELEKVVRLLRESKRPLICASGGCFDWWSKELSRLVDLTGAPVMIVTTDSIPIYLVTNGLKVFNRYSTSEATESYYRFSLQNFDLLLALDTNYSYHENITGLRQIDSSTVILLGGSEFEHDEEEEKGEKKFQPGTVSYVDYDDMKSVLKRLNHLLEDDDTGGLDLNNRDLCNWRERIEEANRWNLYVHDYDDKEFLDESYVQDCLNNILKYDQTYYLNGHRNLRVKLWDWHTRKCKGSFTLRDHAIMDENISASTGAAIGKTRTSEEEDEVNVIFTLYLECGWNNPLTKHHQELLVVKRENVPVKIVFFNEVLNYNEVNLQNPDLFSVARSLGIPCSKVVETEELSDALKVMMETPGPYFLDIMSPFFPEAVIDDDDL